MMSSRWSSGLECTGNAQVLSDSAPSIVGRGAAHPRRDAVDHDLDYFAALERLRPAGDLDRFELAGCAGGLTEAVGGEDVDDLVIQLEPKAPLTMQSIDVGERGAHCLHRAFVVPELPRDCRHCLPEPLFLWIERVDGDRPDRGRSSRRHWGATR